MPKRKVTIGIKIDGKVEYMQTCAVDNSFDIKKLIAVMDVFMKFNGKEKK